MSFQMSPRWSPSWQRFVAEAAPAASPARPPFHRVPLVAGNPTPPAADAGAPPSRPTPPVDRRPLPPEPPRRPLELAWLTWQLSAPLRAPAVENLRQTLGWRAQYCPPLDAPKKPPKYRRFGVQGEHLVPIGAITLRKRLRAELRESIRTLEATQPLLERNWKLAMHSARLGQSCAELDQRGIDALEELRGGLIWLWD